MAFLTQGDGGLVFLFGLLGEKFSALYAIHPLLPLLKDSSEFTQPSHPFDEVAGGDLCRGGFREEVLYASSCPAAVPEVTTSDRIRPEMILHVGLEMIRIDA